MQHVRHLYEEKKDFYRYLILLTLPIILQNLITSSLNLLDTLMIGRLGEVKLAAVGVANQYYFFYSLLLFGIAAGCAVLVAQFNGKKELHAIKMTLSLSLRTSCMVGLLFSLVGFFFSEDIISLFNDSHDVVTFGAQYLRISIFGYLVTAITFVYAATIRSMGNTLLPMWASLLGLMTNAVLNLILIFGLFGAPELGINGAAIATVIARCLECGILIGVSPMNLDATRLKVADFVKSDPFIGRLLFKVSLPVVLNDASYGLVMLVFTMIYGRIGVEAIATTQITTTIINLFIIAIFGIANASVVIIGNEIGAGREDLVIEKSNDIIRLSLILGFFLSILLLIVSPFFISLYSVSETVSQDAQTILIIFSLFMLFRVYNGLLIVGILRGAGDALFASISQTITMWGIGVPFAYVAAVVYRLPVTAVFFIVSFEEIIRFFVLRHRFKSRRFIHNVVKK